MLQYRCAHMFLAPVYISVGLEVQAFHHGLTVYLEKRVYDHHVFIQMFFVYLV